MNKKNTIITLILLLFISHNIFAQNTIDTSLIKKTAPNDTAKTYLNMDAVYNRPFLNINKVPVSIGGYIETNYQHINTDGVSDGHEFQFRRLSIFIASTISKRIKFLSEIEFENDKDEQLEGKPMEIGIEYAAIDIELNPLLNLRSGIIVNPIGAFNQNHDGPKWEFIDRPKPATEMLPGTFSNAGFGIYGKYYKKKWMLGYELYLTNGFDNSIIDNDKNKTYLPQAKENTARFVNTNSGTLLTTAKITTRHNTIGELGISWMGGIYNKFMEDGLEINTAKKVNVIALDYNTTIPTLNTKIVAEWAKIFVQLPQNFNPQFGTQQQGGFVDIIQPILSRNLLGWQNATLNLALRAEYIDYNIGKFTDTQQNKADELWSIIPAISFRPSSQTVLRLNYRYQKQKDIIGNPPATTAGFSIGLSTYF